MAYINKQLQHYIDISDSYTIPTLFEKFVNKHKTKENIILKKGNSCHCTHCNNEFISNVKINNETRCPYCNNKYIVRKYTLKNYETKKNLIILDKVEDKFVLRVFELESIYNYKSKSFNYYCTEYRRVFFDEYNYNQVVEGDNVSHVMGASYVYHNRKRTCWKKKVWSWYYSGYGNTIGYIYPDNIKNVLKGTKYQYTCLWKLVNKVTPFNLVGLFQKCLNDYYMTFELLVKLKLYNLSLNSNKFGSTKKTFEERFGVPKDLLPFMQKNNITYEELNVLRYCKTPNIRLLRALKGCYNLLWLSYRIDFLTAWKKGLLSHDTEHEYTDYLKFALQLGYNMTDKKVLYPSNLKESHDKLLKLVEICRNEANTKLMKKRYEELKENIYKTNKFIIYPASTADELINESKQMNNCVKTYIEPYAVGETDIYLMRLNSDKEHSLVTVEVKNNVIIQARIKCNNEPSKEQMRFLEKWKQKILNKTIENI
jgi:DNA-directed RNA polymerase subunit RPC12/RpoP